MKIFIFLLDVMETTLGFYDHLLHLLHLSPNTQMTSFCTFCMGSPLLLPSTT
ncbi:hypothetical protein Hanom_Chr09g00848681 [Helianthus anomalus]